MIRPASFFEMDRERRTFHRLAWVLMVGFVVGCAAGPVGDALLRPGPQPLPLSRTVGDRIVYSEADVVLVIEWLPYERLRSYYEGKPGLVNPFERFPPGASRPTAFLLKLSNRGRDPVYFNPQQALLTDQDRRRTLPTSLEDLYFTLAKERGQAAILQTLQATLLSSFIALSPGREREGLLLFPEFPRRAKTLLLEFSSFSIGSEGRPLLFSFEVVRKAR